MTDKTQPELLTPEVQQQLIRFGKPKSFREIISNPEMVAKFPEGYLPKFEIMEDGKIFIQPWQRIHSTNVDNYFRYIPVTKDFQIPSNHDYPYVELPEEGYLINVSVPPVAAKYLKEGYTDYKYDYIIDLNKIKLTNPGETIAGYYNNIDDMRTSDEIYLFRSLELQDIRGDAKDELTDLNYFFKTYLEFMFDGMIMPVMDIPEME